MLTDEEVCDLQEVKYVQKVPGGPGVPKKSPLKELIKIRLVDGLTLWLNNVFFSETRL